jgi:glycine/D-amino acid oxidase-like deaminating enzyme
MPDLKNLCTAFMKITAYETNFRAIVTYLAGRMTRYGENRVFTQPALEAERGYHLMTSPASLPSIPVASFDRKMIMTPMQHGLRLAGTVEFAGITAADNWQRAKLLRRHGEALWPELASTMSQVGPEACWSGLRPTLADSLPVISQSHLPGLWLHFGHQHLGLTLAATSTELLLQCIAGDAAALNKAQPFRVTRF